jgi:hypothetical protein
MSSYVAVAANISDLELVGERNTSPAAKAAVKTAIRPIIRLIPFTFARAVIATIGRRLAAIAFEAELTKRTSQVPENLTRLDFCLISV